MKCYFASGFYSRLRIDHFEQWSEFYQRDMAGPTFVRRVTQIIGTAIIGLPPQLLHTS